ncbi:MAG: ATP-binding protein [Clostridiales bacterium]|jgi:predicted AAA+ superfamily ATPase|nr:ATP-binding protein [Clostridiales bacterium]
MYRKIMKNLSEWKNSPYRKPLILQGARQVGKTFSVLEFGRENYQNVAYFNFETDLNLAQVFAESIDPKDLIPQLSLHSKQSILRGETLIFLDEIQLCPRALTSLKYFCEFAPDYHIIVAGSLLGVAVNRETFSFPVGKVNSLTLRPMDMEEFLLAFGLDELVTKIKNCFEGNLPLPFIEHEELLKKYRQYLVVGGMPECVDKYLRTLDFVLIRHIQKEILGNYLNDMSKYNNQNEIKKTRLVYDNITVQLSKKNTRFQYKLIKTGARASEFENAIEWLTLSGIVNRIYRLDHPQKPLDNYRDIDSFKTYVSDPGLLCAKKDIVAEDVLYLSSDLDDFKGGMVENYVYCQLLANDYKSYYWTSSRGAEVDFVIQREGKIIPIEVKSADNTKAKSLSIYISVFKPEYSIKLSTKNFGFEDGKKTVPLYAAFCI